ncbi:hypothetical protein ACFCY9_12410 [Streptomyces fimicarius]|uniref:hypothetical protein n=1 Tax=Streptomyces griseus TaxID=1911 RepID=UPI0035E36C35
MTAYTGPATVITSTDEHTAEVDLVITEHRDGLKEWGGSLRVQDEASAWAIFNDDHVKLRIGDSEGMFVPNTVDLDAAGLKIQGSGPAPFGE